MSRWDAAARAVPPPGGLFMIHQKRNPATYLRRRGAETPLRAAFLRLMTTAMLNVRSHPGSPESPLVRAFVSDCEADTTHTHPKPSHVHRFAHMFMMFVHSGIMSRDLETAWKGRETASGPPEPGKI